MEVRIFLLLLSAVPAIRGRDIPVKSGFLESESLLLSEEDVVDVTDLKDAVIDDGVDFETEPVNLYPGLCRYFARNNLRPGFCDPEVVGFDPEDAASVTKELDLERMAGESESREVFNAKLCAYYVVRGYLPTFCRDLYEWPKEQVHEAEETPRKMESLQEEVKVEVEVVEPEVEEVDPVEEVVSPRDGSVSNNGGASAPKPAPASSSTSSSSSSSSSSTTNKKKGTKSPLGNFLNTAAAAAGHQVGSHLGAGLFGSKPSNQPVIIHGGGGHFPGGHPGGHPGGLHQQHPVIFNGGGFNNGGFVHNGGHFHNGYQTNGQPIYINGGGFSNGGGGPVYIGGPGGVGHVAHGGGLSNVPIVIAGGGGGGGHLANGVIVNGGGGGHLTNGVFVGGGHPGSYPGYLTTSSSGLGSSVQSNGGFSDFQTTHFNNHGTFSNYDPYGPFKARRSEVKVNNGHGRDDQKTPIKSITGVLAEIALLEAVTQSLQQKQPAKSGGFYRPHHGHGYPVYYSNNPYHYYPHNFPHHYFYPIPGASPQPGQGAPGPFKRENEAGEELKIEEGSKIEGAKKEPSSVNKEQLFLLPIN